MRLGKRKCKCGYAWRSAFGTNVNPRIEMEPRAVDRASSVKKHDCQSMKTTQIKSLSQLWESRTKDWGLIRYVVVRKWASRSMCKSFDKDSHKSNVKDTAEFCVFMKKRSDASRSRNLLGKAKSKYASSQQCSVREKKEEGPSRVEKSKEREQARYEKLRRICNAI